MKQLLSSSLTFPARSRDWSGPHPPAAEIWPWLSRAGRPAGRDPISEVDSLNRALVAGLMLELILTKPHLLEESGSSRHLVKDSLKSTLAVQLAGHIPLASFHNLAQGLDRWFESLYPLIAGTGLGRKGTTPPSDSPSPRKSLLREDLFMACLENTPGLLPRRRHRKLSRDKLKRFLGNTGGDWFRLRDFEEYFAVDRKTAWEYAHKLLQAGLLVHNQGHSSAVRYRLGSSFLNEPGEFPGDRPQDTGQADITPLSGVGRFNL